MKLPFISHKLNPLNYLFGRIFLGFWGAVVALIWLALFVSQQISQYQGVKPIDGYQKSQLEQYRKKLQNIERNQLIPQLEKLKRAHRNRIYIVKETNSTELISTTSTLDKNITPDKLMQLALEQTPLQLRLERYILTGPVRFQIEGEQYKLFIAYRNKPRAEFYRLLISMPDSLKFILCALVTILPCWLIARSISQPINRLRSSSYILARGDLSHRIDKIANRKDEVGDLARDFNHMASKLEHQFELHKRLLADVSHELRTPLTRLELSLALAMKNPKSCESQLDRIETELHKLDDMIASVLRLARLENEELALDIQSLNLTDLVADILDSADVEAEQKQIKIKDNLESDIYIKADAILLNCAIENIVRNAIKYSSENKPIEILVSETDKFAIIEVIDCGPGVNLSELDKIFTPFYRVTKTRERTATGTGLGLAIAQKAIHRHNGIITAKNKPAENNKSSGLIVTIKIPKGL